MTIVGAPEHDRTARAGVVALGVSVVVVVVAATIAGAGLPGYEVVWAVHLVALLAWRFVGRRTFRDLLRTSGSLRWAALAVVVAGAVPAAVMAVMGLAGATATGAASGLWVGLFAALVIGGVVNGLPEELAFRGVLLRGLTSAWGQGWAIVVTALLSPRSTCRGCWLRTGASAWTT